MIEVIIDEDNEYRIDRWLKNNYAIPFNLIHKVLRVGKVKVNGKKVKNNYQLIKGDNVKIFEKFSTDNKINYASKPKAFISDEEVKNLVKSIVYEDESLIVINKRPGLAVQGGNKVRISVDDILKKINPSYRLVHRLDKDTSGALVVAKNRKSAQDLISQFSSNKIKKIYWALVVGRLPSRSGEVKLNLLDDGKRIVISKEGKRSLSRYYVIENLLDKLSFVELYPVTGRKHQLRAHLEAIGNSIIGDKKYSIRDKSIDDSRFKLQLHARCIEINGRKFYADLPKHMQDVFEEFGFDSGLKKIYLND